MEDARYRAVLDDQFAASRARIAVSTEWGDDEWAEVVERLMLSSAPLRQEAFYPLVAHLFTAAGFPAWRPAQGDTSNRIDLVLIDRVDSLPVEVKSRTESAVINVKAVQQALENRVVLDCRAFRPALPDSTSLAVGYDYPPPRSDVAELVADIHAAFDVAVGLISIRVLYAMAVRRTLLGEVVPRSALAELLGPLG